MVRTSTKGIFQSDILIRTAVIEGLRELREKPWLLDFVFAWLMSDDLTLKTYGAKELQDAKNWFLNTEVEVTMAYREDRPTYPAIGIELLESSESGANSLGDVHYEPTEDVAATEIIIQPSPVLGPFTPKSYDSTTGTVTLPDDLTTASLFEGNVLFDAVSNKGYPIRSVVDDSTFTIDIGIAADFTRAYVAPITSFFVAHLESMEMQERYRLRVFVNTGIVQLTILHSILMFILMRRKQDLLEGRGFERTTITTQQIQLSQGEENPEKVWLRDVIVSGYVRQYWPKDIVQKIDGIVVSGIKVLDGGTSPAALEQNIIDQGWEMDGDQFIK